MDALVIKKANAMPAPTWSWLKMNETKVAVPAGLERDCPVVIENAGDLLETRAASRAPSRSCSSAWTPAAATPIPAPSCAPRRGTTRHRDLVDTPALSSYEKKVALSQIAGDVAADFETGVGRDARAYLNFLAGGTAVLATEPGDEASATVRVSARPGTSSSASIDVVAAEDSELDLAISIDAACGADQAAFAGSALRVFAGERSRVNVTVYLTCGAGVTCVKKSGFILDDDARVTVRHVVLGGSFTATGLAADLRGDRSRIDIDTSYLGARAQTSATSTTSSPPPRQEDRVQPGRKRRAHRNVQEDPARHHRPHARRQGSPGQRARDRASGKQGRGQQDRAHDLVR